jgi:hypothetical protein
MPWPLYPREKGHDTHWIGSWMGPSAGLDVRTDKSCPPGNRTLVISPVANYYTLITILIELFQLSLKAFIKIGRSNKRPKIFKLNTRFVNASMSAVFHPMGIGVLFWW